MSISRAIVILAGAFVLALAWLPLASQGVPTWTLPDLPVGALLFALVAAPLLLRGRTPTPPASVEAFNE
jgi:hypothetical protein